MGDLLPSDHLSRCVAFVRADLDEIEASAAAERIAFREREKSARVRKQDEEQEAGPSPSLPSAADASSTPPSSKARSSKSLKSSLPSVRHPDIPVVSGHTGAGVQELWRSILECNKAVSAKDGVPVHLSVRR